MLPARCSIHESPDSSLTPNFSPCPRCRKLYAPAQPLWSCGILCAPLQTDGQTTQSLVWWDGYNLIIGRAAHDS